jgi:acyl-CoA synthetase (NDP forming)
MWRQRSAAERPPAAPVAFKTDDEAVRRILDETVGQGHTKLTEPDALRVLDAYGIATLPWRFVEANHGGSLARAAGEAAADIGLPVALKIVSPHVVHKTDVGGVALDLETRASVERAVRQMVERVTKRIGKVGGAKGAPAVQGVLVQQMAGEGGIEAIVGATRVPRVGALIMFGMGGIYVEVMRDVALRLAPVLDTDADDMVRQVKLSRLLDGVRGMPRRDRAALAEVILRISQLAERHPRIQELDVNPLLALESGTVAVDARIQVAEPED